MTHVNPYPFRLYLTLELINTDSNIENKILTITPLPNTPFTVKDGYKISESSLATYPKIREIKKKVK